MGFTTVDSVINAISAQQRSQALWFQKRGTAAPTNNRYQTFWDSTGIPGPGANPTNGMAGAAACTSSTQGAIQFTNASGGRTMHIVSAANVCAVKASGHFLIVDRLCHANINNAQATASFSPILDATGRLDTGEGAQLFCEVTTAFSATANTRSFTYTNQDGTGSRETAQVSFVASAPVSTFPYTNYCWIPLQDTDVGIRSISATTLVSGSATGAFNVVLCRPLLALPAYGEMSVMKDYLSSLPALPKLRDNSCLQVIYISLDTSPTQQTIIGSLLIAEN